MIIQTNIGAALPSWFDEKINLATGLAYSGASIGTISGPFFILFFSELYGVRGAFMILAGLWSHVIIVGALQRPYPERDEKKDPKVDKKTNTTETNGKICTPHTGKNGDLVWTSDSSGRSTIMVVDDMYVDVGIVTSNGKNTVMADEKNKAETGDAKSKSAKPTYMRLLKRPKVIRAMIILFAGIAGGLGKPTYILFRTSF